MIRLRRLLIIFLGPQGSGKTTQAILLKRKLETRGYRVIVTEGIYHTVFLRAWHKFLIFLTKRRIRYRFRNEGLIEEFAEPSLLAHMFKIDFIFNLFSAISSFLKISLLLLFYPIVIEHEGYIYNHLAYLLFIYRKLFATGYVLRKYKVLLKMLPRRRLIILLDISNLKPSDLYVRYRKRGSLTEPWHYIKYQAAVYKTFTLIEPQKVILDAGMDKNMLSDITYKLVLQIYESLGITQRIHKRI